MVAPKFARHEGIEFDERNGDWMMIPKFPLPERWRARWCKLLIIFPETYPLTPPIGFYLNRKNFKLKDGSRDSHLIGFGHHNAPDLEEQGWAWYCCYLRDGAGGWRPSARYDQPDNLWTFLNTVREVLTND